MEQTILSGDERREKLLALLLRSDEPLSGGKIGDIYHVSRQVVVQDIALLRSKGIRSYQLRVVMCTRKLQAARIASGL